IRADDIARAVGIARDSPERISAGILHQLREAADTGGNCYLPATSLATSASTLLSVPAADVAHMLDTMVIDGRLIADDPPHPGAPRRQRTVWLPVLHRPETAVPRRLRDLLDTSHDYLPDFANTDWDATFAQLTTQIGVTLAPEQQAAVRLALTNHLAILT